jgi:hypothetical protein
MRIETVIKLVAYALVFAAFYATFARLAHSGADIPPQWGGYYPPPVVRNSCLLTYRADKSFRCDRIKSGNFEP